MPREMSRRSFLASTGGAMLASAFLPPELARLLERGPSRSITSGRGVLSEIEHVVVLMQENRSFDHYFGAMPGVRGFSDYAKSPSVFKQPDSLNTDTYLLPFHADTTKSSAQAIPSNSHSWGPQHESWNSGAMDGFVSSHVALSEADGQYVMAYFTQDDIPFHWALADAFTICDGYHCSVLGPTWPNRLYLMSGTINPQGNLGGPVYGNYVPSSGYQWTTYPEMLTAAGVSWRVYQEDDNYGMNVLEYFSQYQDAATNSPLYQNGMKFYETGRFEYDAANDKLPTVSWIIPTSYESEHPDYMPAAGADFIASKVNAIASNPDVWAKTVFVLMYDENDGFFDHITPPTAPAGTADEYITVDGASAPIGLGFRVPCIVVSPWTVGGKVCSETFDHTSVIQLLESVTGVTNTNISAWRRSTVSNLSAALGCKPAATVPRLPSTTANLIAAEKAVETLALPAIPGATQTAPKQGSGTKPPPTTC
jgi:phospholipase C